MAISLGIFPIFIQNHVCSDDMRHVDKLASGKSDASSARKQKFNPLTWHGWPRGSQGIQEVPGAATRDIRWDYDINGETPLYQGYVQENVIQLHCIFFWPASTRHLKTSLTREYGLYRAPVRTCDHRLKLTTDLGCRNCTAWCSSAMCIHLWPLCAVDREWQLHSVRSMLASSWIF